MKTKPTYIRLMRIAKKMFVFILLTGLFCAKAEAQTFQKKYIITADTNSRKDFCTFKLSINGSASFAIGISTPKSNDTVNTLDLVQVSFVLKRHLHFITQNEIDSIYKDFHAYLLNNALSKPALQIKPQSAEIFIKGTDTVNLKAYIINRKDSNYIYSWAPLEMIMHNREYKDTSCITIKPLSTTTYTLTAIHAADTLRKTITVSVRSVAAQSLFMRAVIYSNLNSIQNEDPKGLSQIYGALSIPLRKPQGISVNARDAGNFIFLRNAYIQPQWNSAGSQNVPVYKTHDTVSVNNLDIVQYAYLRVSTELNVVTWIVHNKGTDYFHAYASILAGQLFVKDTSVATSSIRVEPNNYWGCKLSAKSESGFSKNFSLESGASIFFVNSFTNSYTNHAGLQYRRLSDTALAGHADRRYTNKNNAFFNLETTVSYNIRQNKASSIFLHFNYYQNLAPYASSSFYKNSYYQIQVGYSADLDALLTNLYKTIVPSGS